MISKIEKIKNIGNFEDYNASGNVTLNKMTFIYAANGAGKTTLARVFQSLATNDGGIIARHKRIGATGEPSVILTSAAGRHKFKGGEWDNALPEVSVFDSHFVANNVYSGFEINSDHHKSLYQFVVGNAGVDIIKKIERVKGLIANCNAEQKRLSDLIIATTKIQDVNYVMELPQDSNIDELIKKKEEELTLAKSQTQILKQAVPQVIQNANIPFDYKGARAVMEHTVEGIGQQYLELVKAHLNKLYVAGITDSMDWAFKGKKAAGENCPFCGQDLSGAAELIEGYNQFFREEYRIAVQRANEIKSQFDAINVGKHIERINNEYKRICDQMKFWEPLIPDLPARPPFDIDSLKVEETYTAVSKLFAKKAANPVDALDFKVMYSYYYAIEDIVKQVNAVNEYVKACQAKITVLRGKIRAVDVVQKELKGLQARKARYEDPLKDICIHYSNALYQGDRLQKINKELQRQQKAASNLLFSQYGAKINDYLKNVFNTPFQIEDVKDGGFRGSSRRPNLDYTLTFKGTPIQQDEGMQNTSFKNVLSEGDKNTIAFSFFLAKLTSDPHYADKIVVFDDPLTSLDLNRRLATIEQLVKLYGDCKQVIVLSHNLHFLIDLHERKRIANNQTKCLQIVNRNGISDIEEYAIKSEWIDRYKKAIVAMKDFVDNPDPAKQENAINSIRMSLESFLKMKFCWYIPDYNMTFGNLITLLKNSTCVFVNPNKADVISKLNNLDEMSWRTHHANPDEMDVYHEINLTPVEAKQYVQKTLDMLEKEL